MAQKKDTRLKDVEDALDKITSFLTDYLPLANAHMVDFFTRDILNSFVPEHITKQLLEITDNELPYLANRCHDGIKKSQSEKLKVDVKVATDLNELGVVHPEYVLCDKYLNEWKRGCKRKFRRDVPPNWRHMSLEDFLADAHNKTLDNVDVLTDLDDLDGFSSKNICDRIRIGHGMTSKKNHEVDVMASLCHKMAELHNIKKVVDIGSGKGYLSEQLSLMYHLRVVGVDASNVNTHSAQNRNRKLEKHWSGLLRNAQANASDSTKSRLPSDTNNTHMQNHCSGVDGSISQLTISGSHSHQNCIGGRALPLDEGKVQNQTVNSGEVKGEDISESFVPVTMFVDIHTKLHDIVVQNLPKDASNMAYSDKLLLTGLHTCGDLAANVLRMFTHDPSAHVLCNVGCCYHLIEEKLVRNSFLKDDESDPVENGFPLSKYLVEKRWILGRNARMLAAQALDRIADAKKQPSKSLLYRAILQVILRDLLQEDRFDWSVGKVASKCENFPQYVRKCMKKLKVDDSKLSDEDISKYWEEYSIYDRHINAFFQLRTTLAPSIESVILLDRLCYLLEQGISNAHLVKLFDPVISPRCYAVVATKER